MHDVAFRIAPRLNASGRIDHAFRALELLTTADAARANVLADEIEVANTERRRMQERVVEAALDRLERTFDAARDALVVEAGTPAEGWHRGVLGIAASKVAHEVSRPVLLLAREDGRVGGSGRTWGRTPLYDRIAPVARRHAADFGGHHAAIGLSVADGVLRRVPRGGAGRIRGGARRRGVERRLRGRHGALSRRGDARRSSTALSRLEPHGVGKPEAPLPPPLSLVGRPGPAGRGTGPSARRTSGTGRASRPSAGPSGRSRVRSAAGRGTSSRTVAHDAFLGRPGLTVLDAVRSEGA